MNGEPPAAVLLALLDNGRMPETPDVKIVVPGGGVMVQRVNNAPSIGEATQLGTPHLRVSAHEAVRPATY